MPGKIKVKVLAGRNLPVMDRASDTTDAFVEIKFGGVTHKTDVCRKSLNPHWSSTEWYRFEVDESELQDEPLQLRLMDHDTYSANDAIGKVVISLAPLLAREANNAKSTAGGHGGAVLSGWIPVFDTMHGIRGELNVIVKVELFSDFNKYKTSSCGVQFFHCPMIPPGYKATSIHGFVEELVVNDDPEYQWIDKIRTPRASNEARQVAFIKLSNQVQRLVGLKAAELGANAVVGYQQDFDLEGEAGVVARAIGTAVSITPLPTPSQPISIPACTQQQLRKYLDILSTDTEHITDLNEYFQCHPDELQRFLNILHPRSSLFDDQDNLDDDDKSAQFTRQSSVKSYAGSVSIYQDDYISQKSLRHIHDDQTDLNKLLNRKDSDEDSDSTNTLKKIKKFKPNLFFKRLSSVRSVRRKSDRQDDSVSIKSNSSDTSKISLVDIKNEFKKLKKLKKPKFKKTFANKFDEGVGMASILARSVIHAHTSLACIAETQDSEHSPNSTTRRASESEPQLNISDDDNAKKSSSESHDTKSEKKVPELLFSSLTNISEDNSETTKRERKMSESCPTTPVVARNEALLKPVEPDFHGSVSSILSGESSEIYSSSDEDDESSDLRTDNERSYETTSSIVQSVLSREVNPDLIAHMEKKLSVLETIPPNQFERSKNQEKNWSQESKTESSETEESTDIDKDAKIGHLIVPSTSGVAESNTFVAPKSNTHHFKFHNPFAHRKSNSISAPCSPTESKSFVYRSSKRIKRQISKISKSNMIKSLSHYSLLPKKKHEKPKHLSQPNSSSDITSKAPSETVLGSPFLSYADLMSLDKEGLDAKQIFHKSDELPHPNVSMYIGSEPVSRASLSGNLFPDDSHVHSREHSVQKEKRVIKPSSLVHTAMETILIDKVQSLLAPTSPDPIPIGNNQFFNDVNEKLEKVEEARNEEARNKSPVSTGIIHTAMETILLDKVQSLLIPTSPDATLLKRFDFDPNAKYATDADNHATNRSNTESNQSSNGSLKELDNNNPSKPIERDSNGVNKASNDNISILSGVKTTVIDKVIHYLEPNKHTEEAPSLIKNAVQITLMDKVQNILSPTNYSESIHQILEYTDEKPEDKKENTSNNEKEPGLVSTAMQTMLMEKAQSLMIEPEENATGNVHKNKLVRQDSVDTVESCKMSKETIKPVLQHFHPILSGAPLETIPSESSVERSESLDVEGHDDCDTNSASVCDNLHAACNVDREREARSDKDKGSPRHARHESYGGKDPVPPATNQNSSLNASSAPMGIHRRSSDSDLSVTPKGSSLNTSSGNVGSGGGAILRPSMNSNNLEMLEYPFLTMTEYPPGFIVHIGGTVCARSVKLVDGGGESALRAAWWAELRTELRAHARALRCNAVIAYTDTAAICEDVCVLSASGTAAVINLDCDFNADLEPLIAGNNGSKIPDENTTECCSVAHVPYSPAAGPYRAELGACGGCRRARVPAVLLSTCAKPSRLTAYPKAVTLTAVAARVRRAPPAGEPAALDISDQLPFLEYELHKLLLAKLRMQGANAVFNLQTQVSVGERCVLALASGCAVRVAALPPPRPPRIKASENDKEALEIQKALWDTFTANKTANGFDVGVPEHNTNGALPEVESEEAPPTLELSADKDACVLELDEAEDVETARCLATRRLHTRMQVFTPALRPARNAPPHAFAQVWRARLPLSGQGVAASTAAERHVARALDGVCYKLRRLRPCALLAPRFQLELPEDEIQLVVSGAAIPLVDPSKPESNGVENGHNDHSGTGDAEDDIFVLDEEQPKQSVVEDSTPANGQSPTMVSLTSLSYIVGARGARRVCALRLLFVRETTAVRELGGLSGFLHTFTCEVLAIVRAYTAALGGNALTSFYITQLMLQDNAHKNQGQCLLSVGGDVVHITY
ncbi:uncharacterized protein LOC128678069 isoform X1 [Plodia interpunctella]|uniref:uncharacterized protein LOC128678069 isoform X1 n=1 Tax=Plodia interpunctella TaxID=58824 RepID=UPI002367672D|nr:uncharacterized protein LOC128678069 isoform X1 [Plodia interpunctella]